MHYKGTTLYDTTIINKENIDKLVNNSNIHKEQGLRVRC